MASTALTADDPQHPIPSVNVIDVHSVWKTGGSELNIVIASPLVADESSRERLLKKIENYLNFIGSQEYAREFGVPTPENTTVAVRVHPDSDPGVYELLKACESWVQKNHAALIVTPLEVPQ